MHGEGVTFGSMSFPCIRGKHECDGCMLCEKPAKVVGHCEACHEEIYAGEEYYDIEGELVHDDHLREWAEKYRVH